jgi:hypothetical protein
MRRLTQRWTAPLHLPSQLSRCRLRRLNQQRTQSSSAGQCQRASGASRVALIAGSGARKRRPRHPDAAAPAPASTAAAAATTTAGTALAATKRSRRSRRRRSNYRHCCCCCYRAGRRRGRMQRLQGLRVIPHERSLDQDCCLYGLAHVMLRVQAAWWVHRHTGSLEKSSCRPPRTGAT